MTRRTLTSSTALSSLIEQASMLLDEGSLPPPQLGRRCPPADPTEALVEAGWFMLQQLNIAMGLALSDGDADRLVPDVLDRASAYGIASGPSVGAAASIVDGVHAADPVALARTILAVRSAFADDEVMAGASALIAALSTQIACSMALDPCVVHRELSERASAKIVVCSSTSGRHRFGGWAGDRRRCGKHLTGVPGRGAMVAVPIFIQHH